MDPVIRKRKKRLDEEGNGEIRKETGRPGDLDVLMGCGEPRTKVGAGISCLYRFLRLHLFWQNAVEQDAFVSLRRAQ